MEMFFHPPTYIQFQFGCFCYFVFVCIELVYIFGKLIKFHQVNKLTLTSRQPERLGGRQAHVSFRDWLRNFDTQFIVSWEVSLSPSQFIIPKHECENTASNNDNGVQYAQQMQKEPNTERAKHVWTYSTQILCCQFWFMQQTIGNGTDEDKNSIFRHQRPSSPSPSPMPAGAERKKTSRQIGQEWQVIQIIHWVCLFPSMIKARIAVIRNINWKIRSQKWISSVDGGTKGDGARSIGFYLFICTGTSIFHRRIWGYYELNSYSLHVLFIYLFILLPFYDYFASFFKSFTRKGYFHSLFFGGLHERKSIFFSQTNAKNFLH